MMPFFSANSPGFMYASDGTQPSPLRPVRRSMRGLYAPIQIGMLCAGAGPRFAPLTR